MAHYWVQWSGRSAATVTAPTAEEARSIAAMHGDVTKIDQLPYPRDPQLNAGGCPSFCYGRSECLGRTACPQRHSCTS